MQILHFIFLLLEDVRWEGDFGDSDSWSSVLPCGNWARMSRGCMEVSWNLFPKPELSHHSRPWGFLPLFGLYQSGELWLFQLHVVAGLDHGFYFQRGGKKSQPSVVYCFSSLKYCFGEPAAGTTWYRKETLTLCSLCTRNCITGQMTATCVLVKDVQHRTGRMGTSLRVSDRLGILFSFLIRWFLMPVAR